MTKKGLIIFMVFLMIISLFPVFLVNAAPSSQLLPNGDFEVDLSGWSASEGSIEQSDEDAHNNTYSLKTLPSSASSRESAVEASRFSLAGDVTYYFSIWVNKNVSTTTGQISLYWYDAVGAAFEGLTDVNTNIGGDTGWTQYTWSGSKYNANTGSVLIFIGFTDAEDDDYQFYVDEVWFGTTAYPEFKYPILLLFLLLSLVPIGVIFIRKKVF